MSKILIYFLIFFNFAAVKSAPYLPKSNDEVVEVVDSSEKLQKIKKLKASLLADPTNQDLALIVAREYLKLGQENSDPRYYSYAKASLKPFWNNRKAAKEIIFLIAEIKQYAHNFDEAIEDLSFILNKSPSFDQARITRANIYNILNQDQKALADCSLLNNEIDKTYCIGLVKAKTANDSQLQAVYQALKQNYKKNDVLSLILLGEISAKLKLTEAESYYKEALKLDDNNVYLLRSYSDFLISQKRYREVSDLISSQTKHDALFVRYLIALKGLKSKALEDGIKELDLRFQEEIKRGDFVHQEELALFEKFVKHE